MQNGKLTTQDRIISGKIFEYSYQKQVNYIYNKLSIREMKDITEGERVIIELFLERHKPKNTILDPIYLSCLNEKEKYDYFIKDYTNKTFNAYKNKVKEYIENPYNKKKIIKYARNHCDTALLSSPLEKRIFKKSTIDILKNSKYRVVDSKILSRYFISEAIKDIDKDLMIINQKCNFRPLRSLNFKEKIEYIKEELSDKFNIWGKYDMLDSIYINHEKMVVDKILHGKKSGIYNSLVTIFHECEHVKQYLEMTDPESYTLDTLNMVKEYTVSDSDYYYQNNYESLYFELKADMEGSISTKRIMKKYCPHLYRKMSNLIELDINVRKKKLGSYRSHLYGDEYYESSDALEHAFLSVFDKETCEGYFSMYPILRLQYNDDGTYKTPGQLKRVRDKLLSEGKNADEVKRLYDNLYWNYIKYKTNINNFYKDNNKRIKDKKSYVK